MQFAERGAANKKSARSVELDAAAGSHHNSRPLWGRWRRVAGTMPEGVDRLGADTTKPITDRRYKYNIKHSARSVDQ